MGTTVRWTTALWSALSILAAGIGPASAGEQEVSGSVGIELRRYVDDPAFPGQLEDVQASLILAPEWSFESEEGRHQITLAPFLRLDAEDDERTHFDLREAYWRFVWSDWELLAGVNKVFWGVAESRHLVDVINQTDALEDIDNEDKLGQPMVQLSLQRGWGRLEGFALLGFRERTFPGPDGRLRTPRPVDTDDPVYESGAEDERIDGALRYSHYFGDWDLGIHAFHGTGREPGFLLSADGRRWIPFYEVIHQLGIDVQYTREAWLWKLEAIGREGQGDTFGAGVAGFEYTFYQVGDSAADVGLLVEYLVDDRDATAPPTAFDDDVFVGSRLAFNDAQDTQILAGAIVDRHDGSTAAFIEAERRLGESYKLELESRWFLDVDPGDTLAPLDRDSFVTLRLSRYF
jgi:hypothetical protein